jgi:DivIVA domain-containing protein
MDRAEIVADIRSSLFPTSLLRRGYDMGAVDDVLDDLVTRIEEGAPADEIERFVIGLAFATAVGGYDEAAVDDLLHRVVDALKGEEASVGGLEPTSASGGPAAGPEQEGSAQPGSALIEPRRGFFARLFGR